LLSNYDIHTLTETTSSYSSHRLVDLLKQATTLQIEQEKEHFENPKLTPKINTYDSTIIRLHFRLMEDFHSLVFPNQCVMTLQGHKENVKCIQFIDSKDDLLLASGSSDNTVKLWSCSSGANLSTFTGHTSRIWDLSFNKQSNILCSVSGDSSVKVFFVVINQPSFGRLTRKKN
jgi:COMPASS component SWD3